MNLSKTVTLFIFVICIVSYSSCKENTNNPDRPGKSGYDGKTFVNPVYAGNDPWLVNDPNHPGVYYYCSSNRINGEDVISVSKTNSILDRGIVRKVWTAPKGYSGVWAPELHYVNGDWYIYTCWVNQGNPPHDIIVLKADSRDPLGSYTFQGELTTPADFKYAIDATVLQKQDGSLYLVWAGIKADEKWRPSIWIAPMENPVSVDLSQMQCISRPTWPWELDLGTNPKHPDCNEGPEILKRNGKIFIVYSAARTSNASYCLGLLTNVDGNVLNPSSWEKKTKPVFSTRGNILGPGHCSFVKSPDNTEDWIVYHSLFTMDTWDRCVSVQKFTWNENDEPVFGLPVQWGESVPVPSGELANKPGINITDDFSGNNDNWQELYFLNGKTVDIENGEYSLNSKTSPGHGEKCLIRGYDYTDFTVEVDMKIIEGTSDGGIIFRSFDNAIGENCFKGYYAGLNVNRYVELGRANGSEFTSLAKSDVLVKPGSWYHLKLIVKGPKISVFVGNAIKPAIEVEDSTYENGQVGLRAINSHVHFDNFSVTVTR